METKATKKMELTLGEKIMYLFGYKFIFNKNTKEVHFLPHKHQNCRLGLMSRKNKKYLTRRKFYKMLHLEYPLDGCRWCHWWRDSG